MTEQKPLDLGIILCKHCKHVIDTLDTENSIIYYSECNQEACPKLREAEKQGGRTR